VGHKSDDPCVHKKYTEAGVTTFVAHCTYFLKEKKTFVIRDPHAKESFLISSNRGFLVPWAEKIFPDFHPRKNNHNPQAIKNAFSWIEETKIPPSIRQTSSQIKILPDCTTIWER